MRKIKELAEEFFIMLAVMLGLADEESPLPNEQVKQPEKHPHPP
jgi:hypothetical protein